MYDSCVMICYGVVTDAPERREYGDEGQELCDFTVTVTRKRGDRELRHPFRFVTFDDMIMRQLDGVQRGQRVIVEADCSSRQYEKNGKKYENYDFSVRRLTVGVRAARPMQGRADRYGSRKGAPAPAPAPAQLPHEDESDIPF